MNFIRKVFLRVYQLLRRQHVAIHLFKINYRTMHFGMENLKRLIIKKKML